MSASITQSVIRKQLCAMGCEVFEIGVLGMDGRMLLRCGWSADQIDAALAWRKRENARGAQIFVRPHGTHALSLVDDLSAETIPRMADAGFQPAAVVETSPGNFQVWLNHGWILFDRTFSTQAAKELACRFGGDPSSADWRHFGRLAGFTNQKPKRRLQTGLPPFVRLHESEGRTYTAAREFLEDVKSLVHKASAESSTRRVSGASSNDDSVRSLSDFQADPRYSGDLHRADMAWALHAASRGLPEQQIRDEYCMLAIFQKKADLSASSITRDGPRSRRSARSSRSAERAASLWTARSNQIAAAHRSACRSRFAALDVVRRRFTASAPPLRVAPLCHARGLRIRRTEITRNRRGLGETVAPQKWRGVKKTGTPWSPASGRERRSTMDACVMCKRKVQQAENWIKCHLWGGFAIFHWRCFGKYLRTESEQQVESAV